MEFFNFGTSIGQPATREPVTDTKHETVPTKMQFQEEFTREIVYGEISIANMLASLIAKVRYDNANNKETQFQNWEILDECFKSYFLTILEKHSEQKIYNLIDTLLTKSIPIKDYYDRPINIPPPMKVVASNDIKDIKERTRGWNMDFDALEDFTDSNLDTIIATEVKMDYCSWKGFNIESCWCCRCEMIPLPNTTPNGNSKMNRDSLGFVTGSYYLPYNDNPLGVEVRITHCPRNCSTPFTLHQLLMAHITEPMTPISPDEVAGFKFPVFNIPLTTTGIRGIMGASNENSQFVAIQSNGHLQVNKRTPLNWECRSLAVDRERCMTEPIEGYMLFYEKVGNRAWWNNMVEIIIEGHVVTAVMVNDRQHKDTS